ncbi:hypothetical protein ACF0H5_011076 [Mactra antiquata]
MKKSILKNFIRILKLSLQREAAGMMRGGHCAAKCTRYRSCRHGNLLSNSIQHDVYAGYHDRNDARVLTILDDLKRHNIDVYDPYRDSMPNETCFKAWLERGILSAKVSLIFLTKSSVKNHVCRYQIDHAVMHYIKSKGRHRVVLVMLESCKIPKNLKQFNCVFAWKYRDDPINQIKRIMKAISAPQSRFRRGNVMWTAGRSMVGEHMSLKNPKLNQAKKLKNWHLLLNLPKIKFALQNCELQCSSVNCNFRCAGIDLLDQFVQHIKECKYQCVHCSFCGQRIQRKNLQKHEEKTCRYKPKTCPNEGCSKKIPEKLLRGHSVTCQYREEECPNTRHGCVHVFAIKDIDKHLEICDYEQEKCMKCNNYYFRVDIEAHHCGHLLETDGLQNIYVDPVPAVFCCQNAHCGFMGTKQKVKEHSLTCIYRMEPCPDCGKRYSVNDLVWHKKQCDKMAECSLCQHIVPSSSKVTHDRWLCRGRNIQSLCDCCGEMYTRGTFRIHQLQCTKPSNERREAPSMLGSSPDTGAEHHKSKYYAEGGIHVPTSKGHDLNNSQESPTYRLLDTLPDRDKCSTAILLHPSSTTVNKMWNENKRKRWRGFMYQIDNFMYHGGADNLSLRRAYPRMSLTHTT